MFDLNKFFDVNANHKSNQHNQHCFSGLLGCVVPIIKRIRINQPQTEWEVTYDLISDKQFIASGSQGCVFKAKLNNQTVALKKVLNDKEVADTYKLKDLSHMNVAKLIGVCQRPPCVLIEYCPNGSLADLIKLQKGKIRLASTWGFLFQIASGMKYLHYHNIIHRDLKPANILITEDNRIKISDFGTCREFMGNSIQMTFAGTCAYMAPELIKNEKCSEKIDIWSFGVVVWELLTGQRPYSGVENARIMFGVCFNRLHLPVAESCPFAFKDIMYKCFSINPTYRPSFVVILSLLNDPSCVDFCSRTTLAEYNRLKEEWNGDLAKSFKTMNTLSIPAENNVEASEIISIARRELENANRLRLKYEEKFDQILNMINNFKTEGHQKMSEVVKVLTDDTKISRNDDEESIMKCLKKLKDSSPTTFNP